MGGPDLEPPIEDDAVREGTNEDPQIQHNQEGEKEHNNETQEHDVEHDAEHDLVIISETESPKEDAVSRDIFKENGVEINLSNDETDKSESQNQDYVPLKDNTDVLSTPKNDISHPPSQANTLTNKSSEPESSKSNPNKKNEGINNISDVAKAKEISKEKNGYKGNNVVTVELALKNEQNSPEIVIDPKFVKRPYNGKIAAQKIRAISKTSSYRPVSPEIKLKSQPLQNSKKYSFCTVFKCWVLLTFFTAFVCGYAVGGAYLFSHLEKEREMLYNNKIDKWKNDTAILLATELRQVKPYEEVWARKIFHHLEIYEKDLLKASAVGYRREDHEDRGRRWTWSSSLFFSISLMTTTGYGSMTPRSKLGRLAAVFYSCFGIPLAFSWFMTIGYMLATFWVSLFENICCRLCNEKISNPMPVIVPSTRHKESVKLLRMRSNSIVPEEEKLITKTDLKNSTKTGRKVLPENLHDEIGQENNHLAKNQVNFQNRMNKTEQFQAVYHTMDYAIAIIYAFLFFVVYYIFCSIFFAMHEHWALTDILYFSYLFFMTLGSGCHELEDDGAEIKIKNNLFYTIHLCIGYCILAMIVNLIYMMLRGKNLSKTEKSQEVFDTLHPEKF